MKSSRSGRVVLGTALTLLLAACGRADPPAAADPYANGADHPWTYAADRSVQPLAVGSGNTFISFGSVLTATNGWGPIEVNRSNGEQAAGDGRPLTLNGQVYSTGLGVHANSEINFHSPFALPACARLSALVGVDDEVGGRGSVVFQVYADGERLFDSGVMRGHMAARRLDVSLGGKKNLRFVVTDAGDGKNYDHADWVSPMLSCGVNVAPSLTVDPATLSIFHKQTATLRATFGNLSGPVDLRLEVEAGKTTGLELQTTRVNLSGGTSPRDLVIAAPGLPSNPMGPDPDPLTAAYRLVARQNGQDVASAPVTLTEKLLAVTTSAAPGAVRGGFGQPQRVTVTMTVTPPLDGPQAIRLQAATQTGDENFTATPVGLPYGDGGTVRQDFDLTLRADRAGAIPSTVTSIGADYYVISPPFSGYRLPFYGSQGVRFTWTIVR